MYCVVISKITYVCSFKKNKRSLINKLNNNGPKIEPCDTPLIMSYKSLHEERPLVHCFGFVK